MPSSRPPASRHLAADLEITAKRLIRQVNEARSLGAGERVFARAGFIGATMAAIADEAGLPKANLHCYFGAKQGRYRAVLARTLHDWLAPMQAINADAEPREALATYIRARMAMSQPRPMHRASMPTSCCTARRWWLS